MKTLSSAMCLWKKKPEIFCVCPCRGVLVGWQQWWGVSKWAHLAQPGQGLGWFKQGLESTGGISRDENCSMTINLIFLVLHLPARTVVESPSLEVLENVWMWPWRTWFSGDQGVALDLQSLCQPNNSIISWWAHRPSLVREEGISLQHSSPKAEILSHLQGAILSRDREWGWTDPGTEGFVPSTTLPFVCVTSLPRGCESSTSN